MEYGIGPFGPPPPPQAYLPVEGKKNQALIMQAQKLTYTLKNSHNDSERLESYKKLKTLVDNNPWFKEDIFGQMAIKAINSPDADKFKKALKITEASAGSKAKKDVQPIAKKIFKEKENEDDILSDEEDAKVKSSSKPKKDEDDILQTIYQPKQAHHKPSSKKVIDDDIIDDDEEDKQAKPAKKTSPDVSINESLLLDEEVTIDPRDVVYNKNSQNIMKKAEEISDSEAISRLRKSNAGYILTKISFGVTKIYSIIYKREDKFIKQIINVSSDKAILTEKIEILNKKTEIEILNKKTEIEGDRKSIEILGKQNKNITDEEAAKKLLKYNLPYLVTYDSHDKKNYLIHYYSTTEKKDYIVKSEVKFGTDENEKEGIQLGRPEPLYDGKLNPVKDVDKASSSIRTAASYSKRKESRNMEELVKNLQREAQYVNTKLQAGTIPTLHNLIKGFKAGWGEKVKAFLESKTIERKVREYGVMPERVVSQYAVFGPQLKADPTKQLETILGVVLDKYDEVECEFINKANTKEKELWITFPDPERPGRKKRANLSELLKEVNFNHIKLNPSQIKAYDKLLSNKKFLGYNSQNKMQIEDQEAFDKGNEITAGEKKAINIYTGDLYKPINQFMRGDFKGAYKFMIGKNKKKINYINKTEFPDEEDQISNACKECLLHTLVIVQALNKLPDTPQEQYLYRVEGHTLPDKVVAERVQAVRNGGEVTWEMGIISTAFSKPAEDFLESDSKAFILFENCRGKDITAYSQYGTGEREIVLCPTQVQWQYYTKVKAGESSHQTEDVHLFYARPLAVDDENPVIKK